MRTIALLAVAALVGSPLVALAEAPATTQILLQRTSDGRVLFTDRAAPGAKTERSWQIDREDPAAARRRALDVQVEAQIVSERIERRIAAQQRALDDDMQRRSMALERDRVVAYGNDPYADGLVVFAPGRSYGPHRHHGSRADQRPGRDGRSPGAPRGGQRFTRPGSPGSR